MLIRLSAGELARLVQADIAVMNLETEQLLEFDTVNHVRLAVGQDEWIAVDGREVEIDVAGIDQLTVRTIFVHPVDVGIEVPPDVFAPMASRLLLGSISELLHFWQDCHDLRPMFVHLREHVVVRRPKLGLLALASGPLLVVSLNGVEPVVDEADDEIRERDVDQVTTITAEGLPQRNSLRHVFVAIGLGLHVTRWLPLEILRELVGAGVLDIDPHRADNLRVELKPLTYDRFTARHIVLLPELTGF